MTVPAAGSLVPLTPYDTVRATVQWRHTYELPVSANFRADLEWRPEPLSDLYDRVSGEWVQDVCGAGEVRRTSFNIVCPAWLPGVVAFRWGRRLVREDGSTYSESFTAWLERVFQIAEPTVAEVTFELVDLVIIPG